MILGWIGFGLITLSFIILNTKFKNWFFHIDAVGTGLLVIHSILIQDLPFIAVNSIIFLSLVVKIFNRGLEK
jgi:hypothetical protein